MKLLEIFLWIRQVVQKLLNEARVLGAVAPGIKRPEGEADQSPPSSAEVKNVRGYTPTYPYIFIAWYLGTGCLHGVVLN
jgi:hypothetical protein